MVHRNESSNGPSAGVVSGKRLTWDGLTLGGRVMANPNVKVEVAEKPDSKRGCENIGTSRSYLSGPSTRYH
jgi:hypothetical protein